MPKSRLSLMLTSLPTNPAIIERQNEAIIIFTSIKSFVNAL